MTTRSGFHQHRHCCLVQLHAKSSPPLSLQCPPWKWCCCCCSSTQGDAFLQIDRDYLATVGSSTGESAGTTALTALVWEGRLYVANAGEHGWQLVSFSLMLPLL